MYWNFFLIKLCRTQLSYINIYLLTSAPIGAFEDKLEIMADTPPDRPTDRLTDKRGHREVHIQ